MSIIVSIGARKRFAAATDLRWITVNLIKGKPSQKEIRERGKEFDANRFVFNPLRPELIGFYSEPISIEGTKRKTGKPIAFSVLFLAVMIEQGHGQAKTILLMQPDLEEFKEKRVLIIIEEGIITRDAFLDKKEANDQAKSYLSTSNVSFFSNTDEIGFKAQPLDWDAVHQMIENRKIRKAAELKKIPQSKTSILLLLIILIGLVFGVFYKIAVLDPREERRAFLASIEADKTPFYREAIATRLEKAGWDRSSLLSRVKEMNRLPLLYKGWRLEQIVCKPTDCKIKYTREGGIYTELANGLPEWKVVYSNSSLSTTVLKQETEPEKIKWVGVSINSLGTEIDLTKKTRPAYQELMDVGVTITFQEPTVILPDSLSIDNSAVKRSAFVNNTPVTLLFPLGITNEVIPRIPSEVYFTEFSIVIADSNATLKVNGNSYNEH